MQQVVISTRSKWQVWLIASVTEIFGPDGDIVYASPNWIVEVPSWLSWLPKPSWEVRIIRRIK